MALNVRSTKRLLWSRLASVSLCLCAFVFLPLPQFAVLACAESAERECPCKESGESSEKELVVCSSARRHLSPFRHRVPSRPRPTGDRLHQVASCAGRLPTIVGHQLAYGLRAPLLI
ncbi:MAG: hypothetical protein GXP28_06795 [Planctomycetes bacterium]|nr:hypothetical protein [Planctomycetota bacterium]